MYILKNSEKYTVFRFLKKKKKFILKISNRSQKKIFREINHIKKLKNLSRFFNKTIPGITNYGKVKKGINKNKGFYEMDFINGPTLSEIFQNNLIKKEKINKLFNELSNCLIEETRKSKLTKNRKSFQIFKLLIDQEYDKIKQKDIFKNLLNRKHIFINYNSFLNISICLKKIFKSKKVTNLKKKYNFICYINHWNFHGGNLLLPNCKIENLKIIDPDSSWKYNDPFFSLARLIYTFPHDTMEYDKYYLKSSDFAIKNAKKSISFQIKYTWKNIALKNYELIFNPFFKNLDNKNNFKNKLNEEEFLRFNLSLILCFLRGINANHQDKINFFSDKSNNFQNKGLYLYLFFLIYLNKFTNKLVDD